MINLRTAVLRRDAQSLGSCVDQLRGQGLRHFEIFEAAHRIDPSISFAEFDSLLAECED